MMANDGKLPIWRGGSIFGAILAVLRGDWRAVFAGSRPAGEYLDTFGQPLDGQARRNRAAQLIPPRAWPLGTDF